MDQKKNTPEEGIQLTPIEALIVHVAGIAKVTDALISGIKATPAQIMPGAGIYVREKTGMDFSIDGTGGKMRTLLTGVKIPIASAHGLADALRLAENTPLVIGLKKKIGDNLGAEIILDKKEAGDDG